MIVLTCGGSGSAGGLATVVGEAGISRIAARMTMGMVITLRKISDDGRHRWMNHEKGGVSILREVAGLAA